MEVKKYMIVALLILVNYTANSQMQVDTVFTADNNSAESKTRVRYFYYPNLYAYFDIRKSVYIYKERGQWITSETVPSKGYSLRNGFHVMIKGYTEDKPYLFFNLHKQTYPADYSSRPKPRSDANAMVD